MPLTVPLVDTHDLLPCLAMDDLIAEVPGQDVTGQPDGSVTKVFKTFLRLGLTCFEVGSRISVISAANLLTSSDG